MEQRFCRKCGLNLETIGESLRLQRNQGGLEMPDRRFEMFGNIAFGGLGVVILFAVAALMYTVIEKFVLTGTSVVFGIAISLFLVFALMSLVYVGLIEAKKDKKRKNSPAPPELEPVDTSKLLVDRPFDPVPSVAENTTELLKAETARRRS